MNAVANDDEGLIEPLAEAETPPAPSRGRKSKRTPEDDGQMSLL